MLHFFMIFFDSKADRSVLSPFLKPKLVINCITIFFVGVVVELSQALLNKLMLWQ